MRIKATNPPRVFKVGKSNISIRDTASVYLEVDEQVTFKTEQGAEYDVCKKSWGYYATPSINGRLRNFGYLTALVENKDTEMRYIMLVNEDSVNDFVQYLLDEELCIREWLS